MDNSKELPTVISFCSGYGGIERGLDLVGVEHRVICYVEIEAYAIANLVAKMESGELAAAPIWSDIKTFPAHLFRDRTSIITGGYPCQPFSQAGKRKGADDPRHLWLYIRQHIQTIRPERTFFENVEGHISLGLPTVISDLETDGYRTAFGLFSAEEVGAPHRRKRVFIMGNAKHNGSPATAQRRSNLQNGNNDTQGQDKAIQFKGTGESRSHENIQTSELAHTCSKGLERSKGQSGTGTQGKPIRHTAQHHAEYVHRFPARPDQEQYEWEHSRVEPRLGRKSNGYTNRVDRLRLLGNGVVPQTAALAWDTLSKRFNNP